MKRDFCRLLTQYLLNLSKTQLSALFIHKFITPSFVANSHFHGKNAFLPARRVD